MTTAPRMLQCSVYVAGWLFTLLTSVDGNPLSKPYIPFRTDPFDQPSVDHPVNLNDESVINHLSRIHSHTAIENTHCPLRFVLGVSKRLHSSSQRSASSAITQAPVIYPVFTAQGPGRQVVYATHYEHLDLLTPSTIRSSSSAAEESRSSQKNTNKKRAMSAGVKEILVQAPDFPLLLEGSVFHTSPILHDVNADGRMDAIVTDYDGGIFIVGLMDTAGSDGRRARLFQSAQVPRLYLRREWLQGRVNETLGIVPPATMAPHPAMRNVTNATKPRRPIENIHDPYHSYFEMYSVNTIKNSNNVLRAVTANLLKQDPMQWQAVQERRQKQRRARKAAAGGSKTSEDGQGSVDAGSHDAPYFDDDDGRQHDPNIDDLEWEQAKQRRRDIHGGGRHLDVLDEIHDGEEPEPDEKNKAAGENAHVGEPHRRLSEENGAKHRNANASGHNDEQQHRGLREDFGSGLSFDEQGEHNTPYEHSDLGMNQRDLQGDHHDMLGNPSEESENVRNERLHQQNLVENDAKPDAHVVEAAIHSNEDHNNGHAGEDEPLVREQGGLYDDLIDQPGRIEQAQDVPYDDYGIDDPNPQHNEERVVPAYDDFNPEFGVHDDYERYGRGHYDDYYRFHNSAHQEYYDSKHYIRISPHVLATPTLAELPKLYSNTEEKEEILFVPVSYYLDEDEYEGILPYQRFSEKDHGDETEVDRGRYVASALLTYILGDSPRWSGEQHLDLSSDYSAPMNVSVVLGIEEREDRTHMGAFALASPTVVDIDGDGKMEVIMGTSMGMVYCLDARSLYKKDHWPIQMKFPVESRVIVEDLTGDVNLEVLVADIGGNIVCLDREGKRLWHRNLAASVGATYSDIIGSSPMVLADVNGDGKLNVVVAVAIAGKGSLIFVLDAESGVDSINFPLQLEIPDQQYDVRSLHEKLAQPLLVDLSTDKTFIEDYIRRRGAPKRHVITATHKAGLHIVYPCGESLYIIDALSGCTHAMAIGEVVTAPVQVDDVHGTNKLDLVVATHDGNIITLESQTPYHPLNVWNNGETRSRFGGAVHGYSASQGLYVHEVSRQYIDVFGVYVHVTLEVFDNRRNVGKDHRKYNVEIRDGSSHKRTLFRAQYEEPGVYSERVFIRFGPGYYGLHVLLTTSHGLVYEDVFHIGYNVHYLSGFGALIWLPLMTFSLIIVIYAIKGQRNDDHDRINGSSDDDTRQRSLPT